MVLKKDYITNPKTDGYRSIHLVFKYRNARAPEYDGLHLELQLRTKLQHAWATAVETMGTFLNQALKSRQGEESWLKFFEVTGSAFAFLEKSPRVPGYESLTEAETFARVAKAEKELKVLEKLRAFSQAVNTIAQDKKSGGYHLVVLDTAKKQVTITGYSRDRLEQAVSEYAAAEKRAKDGDPLEVVLVSAGPVDNLRRAYPNYFFWIRMTLFNRWKKLFWLLRKKIERSRRRGTGSPCIPFGRTVGKEPEFQNENNNFGWVRPAFNLVRF